MYFAMHGRVHRLAVFQPFLRFWMLTTPLVCATTRYSFQPFLRFWMLTTPLVCATTRYSFQPFLRFWSLCGWLLWVFKFFCCFLQVRRSA